MTGQGFRKGGSVLPDLKGPENMSPAAVRMCVLRRAFFVPFVLLQFCQSGKQGLTVRKVLCVGYYDGIERLATIFCPVIGIRE